MTKRTLEKRVSDLEDLLGEFSMRLLMLSRGLNDEVERKIRGVRTIRGNDGVQLAVEKDSPEIKMPPRKKQAWT